MTSLPLSKIICFCGHPGAGKSEAQKILLERYGVTPVDDAWPLRDFAMRHLGLTQEDVTSQKGKAQTIQFGGKSFTIRWFLGELGNALEGMLGPNALPLMAMTQLEPGQYYCIASLRRDQAFLWKKLGALIVEIDNPVVAPSPHAFDAFNKAAVDVVIENHGLAWGHNRVVARQHLIDRLDWLMETYFDRKRPLNDVDN